MKILAHWLIIISAAYFCIAPIEPVHAQASRTWVSGVGDDANPCSRTAPCKTFAGAISKTAALGEINCLDPAGYGAVTIVKSITIDCHEVYASILNAGTNGIIINFDSFADARKTVRIRNINFNGFNTGLIGIRIVGAASAGSAVFVEDCLIDGDFGAGARGVRDERTGGGELSIADTTIRNSGGPGVAIVPASGSTRIDAILDNVRVQNTNFGVSVGNGMRVMINRSVFTGNTQAGVQADAGAEMNISNSVMSSNLIGVQAAGTIRLSNNDIAFNGTGISGATQSYGDNRISGNGAAGTTPSLIGANSPPFGQQ